jgi:hypothetical protein
MTNQENDSIFAFMESTLRRQVSNEPLSLLPLLLLCLLFLVSCGKQEEPIPAVVPQMVSYGKWPSTPPACAKIWRTRSKAITLVTAEERSADSIAFEECCFSPMMQKFCDQADARLRKRMTSICFDPWSRTMPFTKKRFGIPAECDKSWLRTDAQKFASCCLQHNACWYLELSDSGWDTNRLVYPGLRLPPKNTLKVFACLSTDSMKHKKTCDSIRWE